MTPANGLALTLSGLKRIVDDIRSYGYCRLETGGFLLLPRDTSAISVVALAGHLGIDRRSNLFQVSARALDRLFTFADDRDLWVPIQFHSHGTGAFLSHTDRTHGLCVEDFISVVVPHFRKPPLDLTAWGWWRYTDGRWIAIEPADEVEGSTEVVVFDEDGVNAH